LSFYLRAFTFELSASTFYLQSSRQIANFLN
jgi:hypothetical protein